MSDDSDRDAKEADGTPPPEAPEPKASDDDAKADQDKTDEAKPDRARRREARRARIEADTKADDDAPKPVIPKPNYVFLVVAGLIALAADLGSKAWAVSKLDGPGNKKIVVIEGFWNFDLARNPGGAWGILGDQPESIRLPFFFAISALAVGFIVSLYRKLEPHQTALKWALPLVLGGALGNLADRIRYQRVVDFIDMYVTMDGQVKHWPTYNVADIWICVGVALMAVDMFTPRRPVRRAPPVVVPDAEKDESRAEQA